MANIKSIEESGSKWTRRAAVAGPDYENGVRNPRRPWADAAKAAEGNYKAGVVAAAQAGRYGKGISAVGEQGWAEAAIAKGPTRFAEGVQLAQGKWEQGFAPYQAAIASLKLPPRGPKGSPQNLQRVSAVATALRNVSKGPGTG